MGKVLSSASTARAKVRECRIFVRVSIQVSSDYINIPVTRQRIVGYSGVLRFFYCRAGARREATSRHTFRVWGLPDHTMLHLFEASCTVLILAYVADETSERF